MNIKEYTEWVEKLSYYPEVGENLEYPLISLAGEVGEMLNEFKKFLRGDFRYSDRFGEMTAFARNEMIAELGDVYFYLIRVTSELGISPEIVMQMNIDKLAQRHPDKIPEYWKGDPE
jgi:NTP pyrophosphatase (non-canonical NTP hydrolase)